MVFEVTYGFHPAFILHFVDDPMHTFGRREFLNTGLGGLAAAFAAGPMVLGKDKPAAKAKAKGTTSTKGEFAPDTLFLTWQRDPTTTMTIQWVGEANELPNPSISYSTASPSATGALAVAGTAGTVADPLPGDAWQTARVSTKPFLPTDLKVFRCELTGLTPGTDYRFRIGPNSPTYWFRTMPAKLTNAFHFVSGGDCGTNDHVIANNKIAARQDPWFILIGGDVAYDNGKTPAETLKFLRNYSKHTVDSKGRLIPLVVCIGNHEVLGGYGKPRSAGPMYFSLFDGLYSETSYATLDFGDYLSLVLLDTGHVAKIEGEQTSWLDKVLRERQGLPHLLAVNHVPAYPSFRPEEAAKGKAGTGEGNRQHWVPLFERYQVDAVLEHHDHTFKRTHPLTGGHTDKNGILYLGDGSWGKLRAPKPAEKKPYLATTSQSYHLTVHRLEDEQRFHVALDEYGKLVDVCMSGKKPRKRG